MTRESHNLQSNQVNWTLAMHDVLTVSSWRPKLSTWVTVLYCRSGPRQNLQRKWTFCWRPLELESEPFGVLYTVYGQGRFKEEGQNWLPWVPAYGPLVLDVFFFMWAAGRQIFQFSPLLPGWGGGTPVYKLYGYVLRDRVWFSSCSFLNPIHSRTMGSFNRKRLAGLLVYAKQAKT